MYTSQEIWLPYQPHYFILVVLLEHQEQCTKEQDGEIAQLTQKGNIGPIVGEDFKDHLSSDRPQCHVLNTSTVTKNVADALTALEEDNRQIFLLIEGSPGIGKSALLKYVTSLWGKKLLLLKIVLLVYLRNSITWQAASISDLVKLFSNETQNQGLKKLQ